MVYHYEMRLDRIKAERDELIAVLREYIEAADNSVNCKDGDDTAAMVRFGKADEAARKLLAKVTK